MKKGKSLTLLSIICFIMALLVVMTFIKFPVGVKNYNGILGAIDLDYDIAGGTSYTLTLAEDNSEEIEDIEEVTNTLSKRLNALGYSSYSVKYIKDNDPDIKDYKIVINARGEVDKYGKTDTSTLASDIEAVAVFGELHFYGGSSSNPTDEILTDIKAIQSAKYSGVSVIDDTTYYQVAVTFTKDAFSVLEESLNAGDYYLSIKLDDTEILAGTSAISKNYFNGRTITINSGSEASARQEALKLAYGGLSYKFDISDGVEVSSPYGENFATYCALAISALLIIAVVALLIIYKGYGIVALLSMILFMVLQLFMLVAIPGIRLSIGGVIGLVLSIVLCVDGMVVIFKRVSEEYANGKTVKACINTGYRRSNFPIISICVIGLVVSLLIFAFANGILRNFAIVFAIGSVLSAITDLLFVRMFLSLLVPITENAEKFFGLRRKEIA